MVDSRGKLRSAATHQVESTDSVDSAFDPAGSGGIIARLRASVRDDRSLWIVLSLGLLLRVAIEVFYTPAVFSYYGGDAARYMRLPEAGATGLFGDSAMPAGYPAYLTVMHGLTDWLPLTTLVQHLFGLGAGALLYFAVVRVGAPRWAALLPAAVLAFSGDQLFIEHTLLTEALWIPAVALSMFFFAGSLAAKNPSRWLVAAGGTMMLAALVRNISMFLVALLALWALLAIPARPRLRLWHAALVVIPALAVLGAYLIVSKPIAGAHSGLFEDQGLALYGRTAQFADCSKFTPPEGTRVLCVDTPAPQRPGPFYWNWSPESPLRAKFGFDIDDSHDQELVAEFGKAAILGQPFDYLGTVAKDFVRFFAPEIGNTRPQNGTTPQFMSFASTTPAAQADTLAGQADWVDEKYSGVGSGEASHGVRTVLGTYQSIFRVNGLLMLVLIALNVVGVVLGSGRIRAGSALFLIAGMTLLVIPPAVSSYDARYALPPIALFAAGASFGLALLAELGSASIMRKNSSYSRM